MNYVVLTDRDFTITSSSERVNLSDSRFLHLRDVLKAKPGLRFKALHWEQQQLGTIEVLSSSQSAIELCFLPDPLKQDSIESTWPVRLILALPRPKVFRRILKDVAILGVKEIHLIQCYKVEKSYWQSEYLREEKLNDVLISASEISGDPVPPKIHLHKRFKPFVEDVAVSWTIDGEGYIAERDCEQDGIQDCSRVNRNQSFKTLAIGPEGGWTPYEVQLFMQNGYKKLSLTDRILNVETAVMVGLTVLRKNLFAL